MTLSCSEQNFKTIVQLKYMSWANEICHFRSWRWTSDDAPLIYKPVYTVPVYIGAISSADTKNPAEVPPPSQEDTDSKLSTATQLHSKNKAIITNTMAWPQSPEKQHKISFIKFALSHFYSIFILKMQFRLPSVRSVWHELEHRPTEPDLTGTWN